MNEIEAAQILKDHIVDLQASKECAFKFYRAVGVALAALREKAERDKGCEWCADNYDHRHKTMFRKGSDWNYEAKYCDMCGKRLEEHHEAD